MRKVIPTSLGRYLARPPSYREILLEAVVVAAVFAAVGVTVNAVRPNGIPLVQKTEYKIFVPCPVTTGEVDTLSPKDVHEAGRAALLIDARPKADFDTWHVPGARNVPYDYLEPISEDVVREIASSGAQRVIVYGDGADPDCGEQLAGELAGKGIRNVGFVSGGAPALKESAQKGGQP